MIGRILCWLHFLISSILVLMATFWVDPGFWMNGLGLYLVAPILFINIIMLIKQWPWRD